MTTASTLRAGTLALLAVLGLAVIPAAGCGASAVGYCDRSCDCIGCSEDERLECIDAIEDAERQSEVKGCGEQYNAFFACQDAEFECRSGKIDADGCGPELEELGRCLN